MRTLRPKLKRKPPPKSRPVQTTMFDIPIEESPTNELAIAELIFNGRHRTRIVSKNGDPWWVLSDLVKPLGYRDAERAARTIEEPEYRGTHIVGTPSGDQEMTVVNEAGLYSVIFGSRKPEVKLFKKWIFEEVLPSLRKYGFYAVGSMANSRVSKTARKLKCDVRTAEVRVRDCDINKGTQIRLMAEGGSVNDVVAWHNAIWEGILGVPVRVAREKLNMKPYQTPLDGASRHVLIQIDHAKSQAELKIAATQTPPSGQPKVAWDIARTIVQADLALLGPDHTLDVREDPIRGRVIDIVKTRLASAS